MVRLYHQGLDATIEVSESAATVHTKKGWAPVREPDDASPPAEAQAEESPDEPHDSERSSSRRRRN